MLVTSVAVKSLMKKLCPYPTAQDADEAYPAPFPHPIMKRYPPDMSRMAGEEGIKIPLPTGTKVKTARQISARCTSNAPLEHTHACEPDGLARTVVTRRLEDRVPTLSPSLAGGGNNA